MKDKQKLSKWPRVWEETWNNIIIRDAYLLRKLHFIPQAMGSYGDLYAEEGVPSHECLRQISVKKVQIIG